MQPHAGVVLRRDVVAEHRAQSGRVAGRHAHERGQPGPEVRQPRVAIRDALVGRCDGVRRRTAGARLLVGLPQPVGRFQQRDHARFTFLQIGVQVLRKRERD